MKIFYTRQAIADLERLHNFIAKDNPFAAAAIAAKLLHAVRKLKNFPAIGRKVIVQQSTPAALREIISGKYVIRYLILEKEIHILRVWHGKENR